MSPLLPALLLRAARSHTRTVWDAQLPYVLAPTLARRTAGAPRWHAADAPPSSSAAAAAGGDAPPPPPPADDDAAQEATDAAAAESAAEAALAADLAAAATANANLRDRLARALADMENLRDRTARQVESAKSFAVSGLVKNLFDVADNLERARSAATPPDGGADAASAPARLAALVEGVELTERGLHAALRAAGVERVDVAEGAAFDPHEMDAAFSVPPVAGGPPAGAVAAVTKPGYRLNGRVVRPATVGVVREG